MSVCQCDKKVACASGRNHPGGHTLTWPPVVAPAAVITGSTPVIEDVAKPATCGDPLSLMRRTGAPFLYVRNWSVELRPLLASRSRITETSNASDAAVGDGGGGQIRSGGPNVGGRRRAVRQWYLDFNRAMRLRFLSQLTATFLDVSPST